MALAPAASESVRPAAIPPADAGPARRAATYHPLLVVLAAACAGIALDRYAPLAPMLWWGIALASWLGWYRAFRANRLRLGAVALLIAVAASGAAWHHLRWRCFDVNELGLAAQQSSRPACVEAIAVGSPRRLPAAPFDPLRALPSSERSRFEVDLVAVRDGSDWQPAAGRATVTVAGHLLGVDAGDRLRIVAQLAAPRVALNPGEFDSALHARADRKLALLHCNYPEAVTVLEEATGLHPARLVDRLQRYGDATMWHYLAAERSGLGTSLLLGMREQLEVEQQDAFLRTGTFDLLAISGLHVGILAAALFYALRLGMLPRGVALVCVASITIGYALLTGAQPPVIRATVMVLIACLAIGLGRRALGLNSLAAAGLVLLALNPADLFRTGPQLSFLAVATLTWIAPRIARWPPTDPLTHLIAVTRPLPIRALRFVGIWFIRGLIVSAVLWAVLLPLVMARFHLVPPLGILLHPLLWIPVAAALLSGFCTLLFGWLLPPLAALSARLCDASLHAMDVMVGAAYALPGSHVWVAGPSDAWLLGFYGLLTAWLLQPRWRPPRRWCLALVAGWIAVGIGVPWSNAARDELRCTFLAVGHGTAIVIELPGGRTLLYDAGRLGWPEGGARSISQYLWTRGIHHLDAVILSHADVDHYNALPTLLQRVPIDNVLVAPPMLEHQGTAMRILREAIDAAGIPVTPTFRGDRLLLAADVSLQVMHPPQQGIPGSDNANSIVLAIEYAGRRILLTGDLESPGLEAVVAEEPYDCDVILAPHHGSSRSNPPGFAAWSTPEWVIVSGGHAADQPLVRESYEKAGATVLHTPTVGCVTARIAADGALEVTWFRKAADD